MRSSKILNSRVHADTLCLKLDFKSFLLTVTVFSVMTLIFLFLLMLLVFSNVLLACLMAASSLCHEITNSFAMPLSLFYQRHKQCNLANPCLLYFEVLKESRIFVIPLPVPCHSQCISVCSCLWIAWWLKTQGRHVAEFMHVRRLPEKVSFALCVTFVCFWDL